MTSNGKPCNGQGTLEQATICSMHCQARCCTYITIKIERPNSEADWDEFRWWLCHEGISVVKDEDGWMVIVETRCKHLQGNNLCGTYPHHPNTCQEYDPGNCEYTGSVEFDVCLTTEVDLAHYLERAGLRRGSRVAKAIRDAQKTIRNNPDYPSPFPRGVLPLVATCERKDLG